MATSTHRIPVPRGRYVNISNGNLNCTFVVAYPQEFRMLIGAADMEPDPDTPDFLPLGINMAVNEPARIVTVTDLVAEDDVWLRSEAVDDVVGVLRGEAKIVVG